MVKKRIFVAFLVYFRIGRKKCCDIFHIMAGVSLLVSVTLSSLAGMCTVLPRFGIIH